MVSLTDKMPYSTTIELFRNMQLINNYSIGDKRTKETKVTQEENGKVMVVYNYRGELISSNFLGGNVNLKM